MSVPKKDPIAELLGTDNVEEQAKKIQSLAKTSSAPIVYMTVLIDTRNGDVQISGTEMPFEVAYRFLEQARTHLLNKERMLLLQGAKQDAE